MKSISKTELVIFRLIAEGNTNKEIADNLFRSDRTIDAHRRSIIKKLGARNIANAVYIGLKKNILQ